jgi:DNA polymerase III epsilon subunit-like protein
MPNLSVDAPRHIFLDTETTGVGPDARIVSIAAQLDLNGETCWHFHYLIQPTFDIPIGATAVHGISTQVARDFGVPLIQALTSVASLFNSSSKIKLVGHNISYDRRVLAYDAEQMGQILSWPQSNFCTMRALTPFVHDNRKWPRLEEAYRWMFAEAPSGLHSARADMLTCREIFYEGARRKLWNL